ncbi:hypothetical protein, partial [Serratia marcescens]|uniref:hypothetical protein n=1 Tax=Serratia marcescens TaxID=615 RepID=UPI0019537E63
MPNVLPFLPDEMKDKEHAQNLRNAASVALKALSIGKGLPAPSTRHAEVVLLVLVIDEVGLLAGMMNHH